MVPVGVPTEGQTFLVLKKREQALNWFLNGGGARILLGFWRGIATAFFITKTSRKPRYGIKFKGGVRTFFGI